VTSDLPLGLEPNIIPLLPFLVVVLDLCVVVVVLFLGVCRLLADLAEFIEDIMVPPPLALSCEEQPPAAACALDDNPPLPIMTLPSGILIIMTLLSSASNTLVADNKDIPRWIRPSSQHGSTT